jgi:hypothetical protein
MLVNGKTIFNKDGECIYGYNRKDKENIWEIDIKVNG